MPRDLTPEQETELQELMAQGKGVRAAPTPLQPTGNYLPGREPTGPLRQRMQMAQQNIADVPQRIAEQMGAGPGGQMAGAVGSGILDFLTKPFASPEGAAITAAAGPLAGVGGAVTRATAPALGAFKAKLAGTLTQIGTPAVAGAGTAMLTGGEPGEAAQTGALAGMIGKLFTSARNILSRGRADTRAIKQAIADEVPWFGPTMAKGKPGDIGSLDILRQEGPQILNQQFQAVKEAVIREVGAETPLVLPGITKEAAREAERVLTQQGATGDTLGDMVRLGLAQGLFVDETLTIRQVFDRVLQMKHAKTLPGPLGWLVREQGRRAQDALTGFIQTQTTQGAAYKNALDQWGKGSRVLDLIERLQSEGGLTRGGGPLQPSGVINTKVFQQVLHEGVQDIPQKQFPSLWQAVTRGGNPAHEDRMIAIRGPRVFGSPAGVRFAETLPTLGATRPIGVPHAPATRVGPLAGTLPAAIAVRRMPPNPEVSPQVETPGPRE